MSEIEPKSHPDERGRRDVPKPAWGGPKRQSRYAQHERGHSKIARHAWTRGLCTRRPSNEQRIGATTMTREHGHTYPLTGEHRGSAAESSAQCNRVVPRPTLTIACAASAVAANFVDASTATGREAISSVHDIACRHVGHQPDADWNGTNWTSTREPASVVVSGIRFALFGSHRVDDPHAFCIRR